MPANVIDLRSDTGTLPTEEMRDAMRNAEVGDDGRGEDATVNRLEAMAAQRLGKEAALFVVGGTMGNLVSLMSMTRPGDEILLESEAHTFYYEVGGFAALAGLSPRFVKGRYGVMDPADVEAALRPPNVHFPIPRLVCLENTHNRGGGNALRLDEMAAVVEVARRHGLAVHLDGARMFNAAVALGVEVREIAALADSVTFCLSKGLSCPMGALVAGDRAFVERARRVRQMLGAGFRQVGVVAAAGVVALEKMVDRLAEDHAVARILAEGLTGVRGLQVVSPPIPTNMAFLDVEGLRIDGYQFARDLAAEGVLALAYDARQVRLVTHRHITAEAAEAAVERIARVAGQRRR